MVAPRASYDAHHITSHAPYRHTLIKVGRNNSRNIHVKNRGWKYERPTVAVHKLLISCLTYAMVYLFLN